MAIFISFFCLLVAFLCKRKYYLWINPGSVFFITWGIIFLLYSFKLFGIYEVGINTLFMYLVGLLAFSIAFLQYDKYNYQHGVEVRRRGQLLFYDKSSAFLLLNFALAAIIMGGEAIKRIPYWIAGGASAVKHATVAGSSEEGDMIDILYSLYAAPIQIISVILLAVFVYFPRKRLNYVFVGFGILLMLLRYICTGSKAMISFAIIMIIIVYSYHRNVSGQKTKAIYKFLAVSVAFTILLYLLSSFGEEGSAAEGLYFYISGCIPFSEKALLSIDSEGQFMHGMVSANGIVRAFGYAMKILQLPISFTGQIDDAYDSMMEFEEADYVSGKFVYNAYVSLFIYFYKDAGILGVALISYLWGRFCVFCYKSFLRYGDMMTFLLFLFNTFSLVFSMVRFQPFLIFNTLTYVFIILFYFRNYYRARFRNRKVVVKFQQIPT